MGVNWAFGEDCKGDRVGERGGETAIGQVISALRAAIVHLFEETREKGDLYYNDLTLSELWGKYHFSEAQISVSTYTGAEVPISARCFSD